MTDFVGPFKVGLEFQISERGSSPTGQRIAYFEHAGALKMWRYWVIASGQEVICVSYNCRVEHSVSEQAAVDQIVQSTLFKS
jgi:hypothetical protein